MPVADGVAIVRNSVSRRSLVLDPGLDKLQAFLLEMASGDELSLDGAMRVSGLSRDVCAQVLEALVRGGFMVRLQHDAYIRSYGSTLPLRSV
jgi:hypothetical protein